ncbi:hypothetical protein [Streptomyces lichenis]|uniref:Uncharacterized protein n=1 Tax=Streptomyces lichenis TaxID=2306967 RepID=A0ABT0I4R5_9ACTN|nr:hypothetical protein [Streptomyces lichenis]MCK8676324.1 hypothetical protein [Streptomyces lichenis]
MIADFLAGSTASAGSAANAARAAGGRVRPMPPEARWLGRDDEAARRLKTAAAMTPEFA